MRLELSSAPLNEALAKLERIAALYERIGAAQGGVAAGGGAVRGGGGSRVVSGRSAVGGRGGGGGLVENLMRANPGLPREAAVAMAGNLPAGVAPEAGPTGESAWERTQRSIRTASAIQAARSEQRFSQEQARVGRQATLEVRRNQSRQDALKQRTIREADKLVNDEYRSIQRERAQQFGGGSAGGAGGGRGRGAFNIRERLRSGIPGMSLGFGGSGVLAGAAVVGFVDAIRSSTQAIDELRRAALVTGGSMQETARLQTLGVRATEANALRERLASDPWAIMTLGFQPDPRLGGNQNNAALQQRAIDRLRALRGNPQAQLLAARRMGVGADELRAANLGEGVYQETMGTGRFAPNRHQAEQIADTQQHLSNIWQRIEMGFGRLLPKMFSARSPGNLIGDIREAFSPNAPERKGPDSLQGSIDRQTQATMELVSTMKQTQRDFYGRGMQDRGALPSAIFGADLMKGIRAGRIRLGAFR